MKQDHGGNIDLAIARFGDGDWIDLSTGINRRPWPVGALPEQVWRSLPTEAATARLVRTASAYYGCDPVQLLPVAGASAAIQLIPRLLPRGHAAVLSPSYNEHAASIRANGWQVKECFEPGAMVGADLAVVVNPNNPDGREWSPAALRDLASRCGHLVVDESFADPRPDLSLAQAPPANAIILRSFGKFWGLAGLRLGFVIAAPGLLEIIAQAAGPWSVNGPALEIGAAAMADLDWAEAETGYHSEACLWLDRLARSAGWNTVGGTHLFRLYDTPDAETVQEKLARAHIWSRRFPYSDTWLRLGVPGNDREWKRLGAALRSV